MTDSAKQKRRPGSGVTAGSARRCAARPSGRAWPCSARTGTSPPRSSTTGTGRTLASASTVEADLRGRGGNIAAASGSASRLAERAKAAGITAVVFDRGGFRYHGRVAALADAAREGGLEF